jgi:two-component sensor histidine kinase
MGRAATLEALSRLKQFEPSLALLFVASDLDIPEVSRGVNEVLGECPVIGTSTAGEIANEPITHGVVVSLIASPHLRVRVGMGKQVTKDFKRAIDEALGEADILEYFSPGHPLHQILHASGSRRPGVSPVLLILFSPGATKTQPSLSNDIHTALRKASSNRMPIFGGTSSDYFHFESNFQIVNNMVSSDAIALAFLEAEILFGLGTAHGFVPTTKRALITKASGHIVHELDGQPAVEVCAHLLGISLENLGNGAVWFSQFPFGATDVYGNSQLFVPESILEDGSIQFGPLMRNDQVITLMRATEQDIALAGLSAYEKAIRQGGLKRPSLVAMFSCALRKRLMGNNEAKEIDLVRRKAKTPICGFYTFGEQGMSDDGLPIYTNQSVSTLVFSDELNPVTALIHKGHRIYREFTFRLNKKVIQMKAMSRVNRIVQEEGGAANLLSALANYLTTLFPWAEGAFYLPSGGSHVYTMAAASRSDAFPPQLVEENMPDGHMPIWLVSRGKRFGLLILKQTSDGSPPDAEDLMLAKTIAKLAAKGLHRIDIDRGLRVKLLQLEILNQFGRAMSKSVDSGSQLLSIAKSVRRILKLAFVTLWLVDPTHHFLIKGAFDVDSGVTIGPSDRQNDEALIKWQTDWRSLLSSRDVAVDKCPVKLSPTFSFDFVSLPVMYKGELRGILNLYWRPESGWLNHHGYIYENAELLKSISTQLAMLIENKYLERHTTFLKEIHHRVKNNLQNVASILRLQIRRLDNVSAEQALTDSISRIMSIAVVHDVLCQGEIGMVDLGRLLGSVSSLSLTGQTERPFTIDIAGPPVMIPSREATSLALVVNELVQNAVRHGSGKNGDGKLSVKVEQTPSHVSVLVRDKGSGLPKSFNPDRDGHLGLTIVRTLVREELHGQFILKSGRGTTAKVVFPTPQNRYPVES